MELKLTVNQLQFLEALKRVPIHKALTIQDLENLDNEDLAHIIEAASRLGPIRPVKSDNEAA